MQQIEPMRRKAINMEEARKIVGRLRNGDPGFEGPDLALVVRYHRRLNHASIISAVMAVSSMWGFPQRWGTALLFCAIFGVVSFYAGQQASKLDRIREIFEQSALQNLSDLAAKEGLIKL